MASELILTLYIETVALVLPEYELIGDTFAQRTWCAGSGELTLLCYYISAT